MKNLIYVILAFTFGFSVHAQTEKQVVKTIDSVKAIQVQEQNSGKVQTKVLDGDALPLQKEQNKIIYDNNRIDDHHNSINGNSIDTNDKKEGSTTVRNTANRGANATTARTIIPETITTSTSNETINSNDTVKRRSAKPILRTKVKSTTTNNSKSNIDTKKPRNSSDKTRPSTRIGK